MMMQVGVWTAIMTGSEERGKHAPPSSVERFMEPKKRGPDLALSGKIVPSWRNGMNSVLREPEGST